MPPDGNPSGERINLYVNHFGRGPGPPFGDSGPHGGSTGYFRPYCRYYRGRAAERRCRPAALHQRVRQGGARHPGGSAGTAGSSPCGPGAWSALRPGGSGGEHPRLPPAAGAEWVHHQRQARHRLRAEGDTH